MFFRTPTCTPAALELLMIGYDHLIDEKTQGVLPVWCGSCAIMIAGNADRDRWFDQSSERPALLPPPRLEMRPASAAAFELSPLKRPGIRSSGSLSTQRRTR